MLGLIIWWLVSNLPLLVGRLSINDGVCAVKLRLDCSSQKKILRRDISVLVPRKGKIWDKGKIIKRYQKIIELYILHTVYYTIYYTILCIYYMNYTYIYIYTYISRNVTSFIYYFTNFLSIKVRVRTSRRGLVVKALDSHARSCGFKSCLAQDKDYWWGKVTGAHLHKCAHSPGHCPLWLGNRLHSKSSMSHKKRFGRLQYKSLGMSLGCCMFVVWRLLCNKRLCRS